VATEAKQAKLLVVEDDEMIRMLLADMLCEIGYAVGAEAASVDEALEATRRGVELSRFCAPLLYNVSGVPPTPPRSPGGR
jgi:CheY-like chemotaxis protein